MALTLAVVLLPGCARRNSEVSAEFRALAERYYQARFDFGPSDATSIGVHDRDGKLEDFSESMQQLERASLRAFLDTLTTKIDSTALPLDDQVDYTMLGRDARQRLFQMDETRIFERSPDLYHSTASNAVYTLLLRDFAPLEERLAHIADREEKIPALLEQAKANLENPPKVWTEVAIAQAQGTVQFFSTVVPEAAKKCKDATLRDRLNRANQGAIEAAKDYIHFLEKDLLPRSNGSFALGREKFMQRCREEEGITETPEALLAKGLAAIAENHRQMAEVVRQIDSTATLEQVLARTSARHPSPAGLLDSCRAALGGLRQFVVDRGIVPLPGGEDLRVAETPLFARSLIVAAMDSPGPLETKANEAYYYVTPPDPKWSAAQSEEYLRSFCYGYIYTTSSHEAYPGHYVQGLYQREAPSLVRKLGRSYAYSEGWAHYCEQMLLDEGFSSDPELRLYQLNDALLRLCRLVATIRMHTLGWTVEQTAEFLVQEGYQPRPTAMIEARRYTSDPLVLSYTWGKWRILELREEMKRRMGSDYSIGEFHKRFLALGNVTIPEAERILLLQATPRR